MSMPADIAGVLGREGRSEKETVSFANVRDHVAGVGVQVPLLGGGRAAYVNLDNAATTPAFIPVLECVKRYQEYYSSVHRGTGFKSLLSTHVYECCREIIADFVGADLQHHCVIFTQNATHALNKLAHRLCLTPDDVVVTTLMEHHSNVLPWRLRPCRVEYAAVRPRDGALDTDDLRVKLQRHRGRVKIVSLCGGSNVTGNIPPCREVARLAHEHGAYLALDATQLAANRPLEMGAPDDPERIDFLVFSGHKMYAPFGSGVLVGPKEVFESGVPDMAGGGTVHAVTGSDVVWRRPPEIDEAGTPNVVGAVAMAKAALVLGEIGLDRLAANCRGIVGYILRKLSQIDGVRLFGRTDPKVEADRLGVVSLEADGFEHGLLAAILGYEWGIGVRNGCFCAQPYVRELLGISDAEVNEALKKLAAGDHTTVPGLVRISVGIYNTRDDIDYMAEALACILKDGPQAKYVLDPRSMDYVPEGYEPDYDSYLPWRVRT